MAGVLGVASAAFAQNLGGTPQVSTAQSLRLPENPQVFGSAIPSVVKATAIINGDIITQTDINQRIALLALANGSDLTQGIPAEELDRLKDQMLRNLIDETLQIQAAKASKIQIKPSELDRAIAGLAKQLGQTSEALPAFLASKGTSIGTVKRQIEGEFSWQRLQQAKIESTINVGDDEVNAVLARLNATKGTTEYRVGEIFLAATPATQNEAISNALKILEQLRAGQSFSAYARQYSEASTAAVGGDLGWVRPEMLPAELADTIRQMAPGSVSNPISTAGGVSILAVQDTRSVLTADPRDAILSLKQVSITFPKGMPPSQAEPIVTRFSEAARNVGGCGGAERIAKDFNAEVVTSDGIKMRDLPPALQQMMIPLQVGQATQPFGSLEEGVRTLVICGRDEQDANAPSFDQVYNQLAEERINSRARRYLRDLRRDAVIEFR